MAKQTIGETLTALRGGSGFSLKEASIRTKIPERKIIAWENDKKSPELVEIVKLADLYGVSPDYIFKGVRVSKDSVKRKSTYAENFLQMELNKGVTIYKKQRYLMLIPSVLSAVLLFLAMLDMNDTGNILLIVSAAIIFVMLSVNPVFRNRALKKAGIHNDVGLTEVQLEYKAAIMTTRYICMLIEGILYFILGIVMFLAMYVIEVGYNGADSVNAVYSVVASVSIMFGLFALIASRLNIQK